MREFAAGHDSVEANRLRVWWEALRTGLWPIPLGMAFAAVALYGGAMAVDQMGLEVSALRRWYLYSGTGDDARNLLSTLAAAIITMSSVVFSITVVALSLAANQFGSRLVRTHMADVRTKAALGLFTMTIVYCLLALRSVEKEMPAAEVPHIAVSLGLLLALVCVLALLVFLHFVARSVVADEVIRRAARELEENIAQLPPLELGPNEHSLDDTLPEDFDVRCEILRSRAEGYIEAIAYERLAALCSERDVRVRFEFRAGAFVSRGGWLAFVYPKEALTSELAEAIQEHILIGDRRTATQDVEFTLRHLVDIALRALSPGINDANTALVVIDYLGAALSSLLGKQLPQRIYRDSSGGVRIVARTSDYAGILDAALHQIRQSAASQPSVIIQMLRAIGRVGEHVRLPNQPDALLCHANLVAAAGLRQAQEDVDRDDIQRAFNDVSHKLARIRTSLTGSTNSGFSAECRP